MSSAVHSHACCSHSMSLQLRIGPRAGEEKVLKRKASHIERDAKPKFHNRQWLPDAGPAADYDEAQILLDEVASSMRPYKIPKLEPVEPSLADASLS